MERPNRKARRLCGLIGGMCLLFSTTKVYAADCYIEVQLEDLKSPYSDWEGVTLGLYDVGEILQKQGNPLLIRFMEFQNIHRQQRLLRKRCSR